MSPTRTQGALALAVLLAVCFHLRAQMGPFPTGLDGGNWLLLGRLPAEGGTDPVGVTFAHYPPLLPLLTYAGTRLAVLPQLVSL